MSVCPAFDPLAPYVTSVVGFVDCHARTLGEAGYRALGGGSPIGLAIGGLITIYIALIGYRLLLGETFSVRDGVSSAVKIGLVLALSTQWPAYRTVIYDVAIEGPAELASRILAPSGLGGGDRQGLTARVQGAYDVLDALLHPDPAAIPSRQASPGNADGVPATLPTAAGAAQLSTPSPGFLAASSMILIVGTLAGLLAVRVIAGLLLALGPLFIGCFLFEAMRGLFVGWLRVLIGTAVGAVAGPTVIAIELAILEPQLRLLQQLVAAGTPVPILPGEILATTALFALVLTAALIAVMRAAAGLRLPDAVRRHAMQIVERHQNPSNARPEQREQQAFARQADEGMSRARLVANAVIDLDRREGRTGTVAGGGRVAQIAGSVRAIGESESVTLQPLGQRGRRTSRRLSQAAARRDARA